MKSKLIPMNFVVIKRSFAIFPTLTTDGYEVWLEWLYVIENPYNQYVVYYYAKPPLGKDFGDYIDFNEVYSIPSPPRPTI